MHLIPGADYQRNLDAHYEREANRMEQMTIFDEMPPYSNPTTSFAAAESMREHTARLRDTCLEAIRDLGGLTCDELEIKIGIAHQTISPRILELRRMGAVRDSGEKRFTRSGRRAIVWRAA